MRFLFWKDALDLIYEGQPPKHPVALCLADAVARHGLSKQLLTNLITARELDSAKNGVFATSKELEQYAERTISSIHHLLLQSVGSSRAAAHQAASHIGRAIGIANVLRGTPIMLRHREVRMPQELLSRHKVEMQDMKDYEGLPESEAFRDVVYDLASAAYIHIHTAKSKEGITRDEATLLLPVLPCERYLDKLEKSNFDVFNPDLVVRDMWLPFKLLAQKMKGSLS